MISRTRTRVTVAFGFALAGGIAWSPRASAQWSSLANAPVAGTSVSGALGTTTAGGTAFLETCLLLTDGTVMCHEWGTNHWHRLSPDIKGSYQNGQWDHPPIADMPAGNDANFGCSGCTYAPLFFASAVLADGRVIVIGGEDNNSAGGSFAETNIGFIYDPVANTWGPQLTSEKFGGGRVGDADSIILPDKTFVLMQSGGIAGTRNMEQLGAGDVFTALNATGKADDNDEEGWTNLADGTFLVVDSHISSQSEIYTPSTNTWGNVAAMPVNLPDLNSGGSNELGPGLTRPDGNLVYFSGSPAGQNALYDPGTGVWSHTASMDFPLVSGQTYHFSVHDGPAALLPDGNVLVMASPTDPAEQVSFFPPSHFFEFDVHNNLNEVADSPNAPNLSSFQGRMLVLPTGEVLLTAFNQCEPSASPCPLGAGTTVPTQDIQLYSNGGAPQDGWRPTITSAPAHIGPGSTNSISGTLFNGFSLGAFYGDDAQMSSNYPLVRITATATGDVFYARTHDHSRMGIESVGSTEIETTTFDAPATLEEGACTVVVVVNGIASAPSAVQCTPDQPPVAICQSVTVPAGSTCLGTVTASQVNNGSFDPDGDSLSFSLNPPGPFALGSTGVTLTVTDPASLSGTCTATVTVDDTTPPTLTLPPDLHVESCSGSGAVHVGQATATDNCAAGLTPSGEVISANGVPLNPPVPVVGGNVTLGIGTFVIQWTVSDGVNTVSADQTVTVGAAIEASQTFVLDDRARVNRSGGGPAAVLNAGHGTTQIGNDAVSGEIVSAAPVDILHRASVEGSVLSASTVTKDSDAVVTGSITQNGTVVLPPLPTLPAFPPPSHAGFTVNSGQTASPLAGSYSNTTSVNGGTLVLGAGDYFFQSLTLNSGSTIRATPTTRIFVQTNLTFDAPILAGAGTALQAVFLGFAGQNLSLLAPFNGTLVAPNATVDFGTGAGLVYTGSFFGRDLEVTPGSALVCLAN